MIKAVFFDLDDTLYDHSGTVETTLHTLKERLPTIAHLAETEIISLYHELLEKYHRLFVDGALPFEEAHRQRWAAMLEHWQIADVGAEEMRLFWREHYFANQRLVAGAKELLESLRTNGLATGIVTNNSVSEQVGKIRSLGIEHLVDHLVISEEVGCSKPDERIFRIALERAGLKADEAVMVGDHWENDIVAAARAGIRGVWFNRKRIAMPEATIATEIYSLEPADEVLKLLQDERY